MNDFNIGDRVWLNYEGRAAMRLYDKAVGPATVTVSRKGSSVKSPYQLAFNTGLVIWAEYNQIQSDAFSQRLDLLRSEIASLRDEGYVVEVSVTAPAKPVVL